MASALNPTLDAPLAYSVTDGARRANVSRSEMYNILGRGDLKAKKLGRRTVILHQDLQAYLAALPDYQPEAV